MSRGQVTNVFQFGVKLDACVANVSILLGPNDSLNGKRTKDGLLLVRDACVFGVLSGTNDHKVLLELIKVGGKRTHFTHCRQAN